MSKLYRYLVAGAITAVVLFLVWYFSNVVAYILVSAVLAIIGKPLTEADFRRLGDNPRKPEIAAFCFSEVARLYEEAYATL